jgi:hypothetical protein
MATSKPATKKPAAKKSAPKKTIAKKAAPKATTTKKAAAKKPAVKKPTAKKTSAPKSTTVSAFERYKMIEVAAYYLAEKKGFSGNSADYWTAAEKEIDKKLAGKK